VNIGAAFNVQKSLATLHVAQPRGGQNQHREGIGNKKRSQNQHFGLRIAANKKDFKSPQRRRERKGKKLGTLPYLQYKFFAN
jgi:hypothetical protein